MNNEDIIASNKAYESINYSVKAGIFGFDIADISGSIRLFSDVMKE